MDICGVGLVRVWKFKFDTLSSITANLHINTSSLPRSDEVSSTQLTSVSFHHGSGETSSNTKSSDVDNLSIGKRTRSRSPVKKIVDLSAARPPIRYNPVEVPEEVRIILKRFKKVFKGAWCLPICLKDSAEVDGPDAFLLLQPSADWGLWLLIEPPQTQDGMTSQCQTQIRNRRRLNVCILISLPPESSRINKQERESIVKTY